MLKIVRIHFRKYPRLDPEKDVMKYDFAFLLVKLEIPQSFFFKAWILQPTLNVL